MLAMPTMGFGRSVNEHNVELDILCDWIEGSVLFSTNPLSQPEVVDVLCENFIYAKQDMASQRVSNAWSELRKRHAGLGGSTPFAFEALSIQLRGEPWDISPAHAFCILLSLARWYRGWARQFGRDYSEQGELFEHVTKEALEALFADWTVGQTGWSPRHATKLKGVVKLVCKWLGESEGDFEKWTAGEENEAGLDLVCYRPFADGRAGFPALFFQCASGDWEGKLETPKMQLWRKVVDFTAENLPVKAFSTPFAFLDHDFAQKCMLVNGLLLDRYRLLGAGARKSDWVSDKLKRRLMKWGKPRARKLPKMEE